MRADQYDKLKTLSERLTDVVLIEVDPEKWPGGVDLATLSRDARGDRYWCKKNAAATLTLLTKIQSLTGMVERSQSGSTPPQPEVDDEADLDREIRSAEREAARIIGQFQTGGRRVAKFKEGREG